MTRQRTAPNPNVGQNIAFLMSVTPDLNSQPKLALRTGVAQSTIGRIVRGEVSAQSENLKRIADAFDCETSFLFWSPERLKETFLSGRRLRLPVGELQVRAGISIQEPTGVNGEKSDDSRTANQVEAELLSNFRALPKQEQEQILKKMAELKRHYISLFAELKSKMETQND